ncbi:hypothetical protein [Chryseobacterium sp. c4a]|uniref:hypothetical protein n=1 Tax=Chryseobacterium sp. c4a TaxID=1573582 RepID=UPI00135A16E3|nr:hypothetical protein [Chryseobacterium sp. c4a]
MKKLYTSIGLCLTALFCAQVPQAFSYQTIAFNASGAPVSNGNVSLKISILENAATGNVLYSETHNKTTNSKGLVNLNIGQGAATTGSFGAINWGSNTKFVKVEMDPQGGSNYVNVGVNQLMSVPYAQVSKTVVTGAGQGITLVSPNGTHYTLSVDNSGNLTLPTTPNSDNVFPADLYMYGSYNNFNATAAEQLRNVNSQKIGYKYLSSNTQVKFITSPASSAQVYGADNGYLVTNGTYLTASSNGFYSIGIQNFGLGGIRFQLMNITPKITPNSSNPSIIISPATYNQATQKFSTTISGLTSSNFSGFKINLPANGYDESLGDNLSDGSLDIGGDLIQIPNLNSTPKNFKVEFNINFNGTGEYTIVQI